MQATRNSCLFFTNFELILRSRRVLQVKTVVKFSTTPIHFTMANKNLPSWKQPEGHGELKIFNSLTREKVQKFCNCK